MYTRPFTSPKMKILYLFFCLLAVICATLYANTPGLLFGEEGDFHHVTELQSSGSDDNIIISVSIYLFLMVLMLRLIFWKQNVKPVEFMIASNIRGPTICPRSPPRGPNSYLHFTSARRNIEGTDARTPRPPPRLQDAGAEGAVFVLVTFIFGGKNKSNELAMIRMSEKPTRSQRKSFLLRYLNHRHNAHPKKTKIKKLPEPLSLGRSAHCGAPPLKTRVPP